MNWRAWSVRERLDKANGNHKSGDLGLRRTRRRRGAAGAALGLLSFTTLDRGSRTSRRTRRTGRWRRRSGRTSRSRRSTGACRRPGRPTPRVRRTSALDSPACARQVPAPRARPGRGRCPRTSSSAGTKPLDFASADYAGVTFTAEQQARLAAVFPTGVCDWTKKGVAQVPARGWTTFEAGPGGRPIDPVPVGLGG